MKLNFLMNIKIYDYKNVQGNLKIIWRLVPENFLEADVLDFTDRFLRLNIHEIRSSLMTVLNSEYIYNANQLKNLFSDKNNLAEILLNYLEEKGGIASVRPVISSIEKLSETLKVPSKHSGVTLSQKKTSEFLKEKNDF
ncbi:MAG: hypothetical protein HZC46_08940 [Ignavibacterium album]|nr:hypothetical protein [Ignavibacterium album]